MHEIDNFYNNYKTITSQWCTQIRESSQGIIKTVMNQIIFNQHLDSFEPSEFGELSDFSGLQEKMMEQNKNEIVENFDQLYQSLATFESILNDLKTNIDTIIGLNPKLSSIPQDKLKTFLSSLLEAFSTEFEMRKGIVEDLTNGIHLNSPYDVIVTVTAAWSGRPFTNDRTLSHIEKFLAFESEALHISKLQR